MQSYAYLGIGKNMHWDKARLERFKADVAEDTTPGISARMRRAREFIRRHACEAGLSIDAVAAEIGSSRALATRRFRKETGRSILGEIHEIRIQKMCELLSHSTLPIAMVVERSGYESDGYAKRFFLRRTGMTMCEYRRETTSL